MTGSLRYHAGHLPLDTGDLRLIAVSCRLMAGHLACEAGMTKLRLTTADHCTRI